ncbi:MAG: hypothetical protein WD042_18130 [Phycisphaeraceae bacterium]
MPPKTHLTIDGNQFRINGQLTYPGHTWRGHRIEGLLLNSRMVQGVFDDRNPQTRKRWDYPDGPWDAQRNTREFLAAMPGWRNAGLLGFTINFQGGSPQGYSKDQPWHNCAFEADGTLRDDYTGRMKQILDKADDLGMAPIVGLFYFGQDERLRDEKAVIEATHNATAWLVERGYRHVIIEIANETNIPRYEHEVLKPGRIHELVELARKVSDGRIPIGVSMGGGALPPENIVKASDLLLLHGNGVGQPERIRQMVRSVRKGIPGVQRFPGPVLFNEDDHFDFDKPDNNFIAAVSEYASWGYFDFRMKDEGFDDGYQSVPVNWGISSPRKKAFFGLVKEMTGA